MFAAKALLLHDLLAHPAPGGLGVPPRLRPYFRQQARFVGLHLDPASGALHGALVLDASKLADYTYCLGEREE
ncbi:MAG: hypothetical protein EOO56_27475 [Hymenobacter sp.]|nr:MAG: hypothetical protein EOO56_27475 [Hymenobacter sp.]